MRRQTALLVETGFANGNSVKAALRDILAPDFRLEVLVQTASPEQPLLDEFVDELKRLLQRIDAAVVFLTLFPKSLKQTRTLLETIREVPDLPIVMVADTTEPNDIIELLQAGADDFITLPLQAGNVLPRAWKVMRNSGTTMRARIGAEPGLRRLIGESSAFMNQVEKIPQIARCDANVLITGETGTGKELYARAIHYCSSRAGRPFMPVNCGAIPGELVENELFGHERGAFTSAVTLQTGLVEEANGGTLFLDEVDCLPTFAQVKRLATTISIGSSRLKTGSRFNSRLTPRGGNTPAVYRTGDYWLIPARVATGDVEWPGPQGIPRPRPPHGIAHGYAPLRIIAIGPGDGAVTLGENLRRTIQPLAS